MQYFCCDFYRIFQNSYVGPFWKIEHRFTQRNLIQGVLDFCDEYYFLWSNVRFEVKVMYLCRGYERFSCKKINERLMMCETFCLFQTFSEELWNIRYIGLTHVPKIECLRSYWINTENESDSWYFHENRSGKMRSFIGKLLISTRSSGLWTISVLLNDFFFLY